MKYEAKEYDYSGLRGGTFPQDWGIAALLAHAQDPNVTPDGKGRALAEVERRRDRREQNRSGWW